MTTAAEIQYHLLRWIAWQTGAKCALDNVFVQGSPWESDVVSLTAAHYWHEFEIKVSHHDYLADFQKVHYGRKKHEFLSGDAKPFTRLEIPRPKSFRFVCPAGVIDPEEVPEHAGLLWYKPEEARYYRKFEVEKQAPALRNATKLEPHHLINLLYKACDKAWRRMSGPEPPKGSEPSRRAAMARTLNCSPESR